MEMKLLSAKEIEQLRSSLKNNALEQKLIFMNRQTSFVSEDNNPNLNLDDEVVINAIRSVPCHY